MEKVFYKSMTFWGSILLGLEVALQGLSVYHGFLAPIVAGLGVFMTIFGFRRTIK